MEKNSEKTEDVQILEKILKEEVGHVKNGVKWFKILAEGDQREKFQEIWKKFVGVTAKKVEKMNWKARNKAGFERIWLE